MLKYKVGQHTETLDGYNAVIIGVNENQPFPYQIQDLDTGDIDWCGEGYLSLNVDVLQAENERLKAALEKLLMVSHYTSDAHPKRGIECKRCAQWGITRADVIHLDWCEVGEAKDMLRSEAK